MNDFDSTYGYSLDDLLEFSAPEMPEDFQEFWHKRYERALEQEPILSLRDEGRVYKNVRVFDINYCSTGGVHIGGWLTIPEKKQIKRGFVVLHGYGGREKPDFFLPFDDAAIIYPCCRGLSRSAQPPFSSNPKWHILHDIDKVEKYILGGCVDDIWLGITAILHLYPWIENRLGLLGISFGGGIGALVTAWDKRISSAHFNVPSFGNHQLRLKYQTYGSGESLREFFKDKPDMLLNTLKYYDAALAARFITVPVHCACALDDPVVAPPGQFAIYNSIREDLRQLFVLNYGHQDYPDRKKDELKLLEYLKNFFAALL